MMWTIVRYTLAAIILAFGTEKTEVVEPTPIQIEWIDETETPQYSDEYLAELGYNSLENEW